ncbi:hypothetical protein FE257_000137 [Aspergillus nanangensis]|uniref:Uncharacterized protein n=1 Tax=Aspergillus nanangensis TaxID=2582783 RepID=A0AAD4CYU2_ASPNN|nr:hypothetical protein FE257_000137 [Aspergillus nanangensis]
MSTDDPFSFLEENPGRKQSKKPHWKDKLFSKDRSNRGSTDQQIEAFLGPARTKSVSYGAPYSAAAPPPRLDVSQRWPTAQEVLNAASPVSNPSPTAEAYHPVSVSRPPFKSRPRKGLRVQFNNTGVEVIGEGGDESEVPTVEISLCRNRRGSLDRVPIKSDETMESQPKHPQLRLNTSFGDNDDSGYGGRTTLQRRDTRKPDTRKPAPVQNVQDADFLMTLSPGGSGKRLSFRASPDSETFAQRVRDKMQAEEGRALHHAHQDSPSRAEAEFNMKRPADVAPDSPDSLYETPPISETEPVPPTNVLRSPPTTVPRAAFKPYQGEPTGLPSGGDMRQLSPPKPQHIPREPDFMDSDRPTSRESRDRSPQPPKMSLRAAANHMGDSAFSDLKAYATQYRGLIQVSAEHVKPLMETSLAEWMRAAVWWFLRGKKRLESYARARPSSSGRSSASPNAPELAKQAVVDLAKALWINERIIPQHEELTRHGAMSIDALLAAASAQGDNQLAELLSLHQTIMNHIRSLAMSIKRNNILALLAAEDDGAIQVDTSVWLRYPFFAPDVSAVLSGAASRSMLVDKSGNNFNLVHMMPLGDTSRYFSYGSMFVDVCVSSREDDSQQQFSIPCSLSIIRDRSDWYVFAAIASQSDLVNVMIQSDRKKGPTWDDVDWQVRSHSMSVKLPRGFELDVMFKEDDFKNLWNIVQYTLKTENSLQPEAGESVIFETTLKVFQCMDSATPKAFPAEPIERCRLRLFERSVSITEGTGTRSAHRGFRITVLTTPKVKTLSSVRHLLGHGTPVVFGLLRGEGGAPALLIKIKEDGRVRSNLMTFQSVQERATMHSLLLGMLPREGEVKTSDIALRAFSIEQPADRASGLPAKTHVQFPAGTVAVIDQEHNYVEHGYGPTVLSESLRAFIATEWGSVTDRVNLGPGELKLGLDINNRTGLSLYRPAQQDLTMSVAENLVPSDMPDSLTEFLQLSMAKPMVRRFDFATVKDLHMFQGAVTGFRVLFDSVASSFTISRRRMVVPITKKWEASMARIQIVQQEKVIQLVAFLNGFSHGKCMNFVLKGTDTLESFGRSGKFGVKIVDAKFALPKTDDDIESSFVCLDMPEYAIEHDDISITFDSEADRTNFQSAAPGSVREPSRMGSLRR